MNIVLLGLGQVRLPTGARENLPKRVLNSLGLVQILMQAINVPNSGDFLLLMLAYEVRLGWCTPGVFDCSQSAKEFRAWSGGETVGG